MPVSPKKDIHNILAIVLLHGIVESVPALLTLLSCLHVLKKRVAAGLHDARVLERSGLKSVELHVGFRSLNGRAQTCVGS